MKPDMKKEISNFNEYHKNANFEETPNGCIYYLKSENEPDTDYLKVLEIYDFNIIQYQYKLSFTEYREFYKFFEIYEVKSLLCGYKRDN